MRVSNRQNEDECRSYGARDPSMLTQHFMLGYPIPALRASELMSP